MMRFVAILFLLVAGCLSAVAAEPAANPPGFVPLFDGKTFSGWEGNLEFFRVDDGAIVAGTLKRAIPQNEYLCTTTTYRDFELRLKFELLGENPNGGVQFRSQRVPGSSQMVGYQADMGGKYWGCLYDERRHKLLAGPSEEEQKKLIRPDGWNDCVIRAEGPHIQLWLNGQKTVDYTEPDASIPQEGLFGLQIHQRGPTEAWYQGLWYKDLAGVPASSTAAAPAAEAVLARDGKPLFTIVVEPNAPPAVRFAAQELKRFLDQMTGADFKITTQPGSGPFISLGENSWSKKAGLDVTALAEDAFHIKTTPRAIFILGRDDPTRGAEMFADFPELGMYTMIDAWCFEKATLFGTYAFLEDLGVRWFFPTVAGTFVPLKKDAAVPTAQRTETPAFRMRAVGSPIWNPEEIAKSRALLHPEIYGQLGWSNREYRLWLLRVRASGFWLPMNHYPQKTMWPRRFGKTHPEYFALQPSGKRNTGLNDAVKDERGVGRLCYSQDGVLKETLNDIEAYFSGKRIQERLPFVPTSNSVYNRGWPMNVAAGDYFSILLTDAYMRAPCVCPACSARSYSEGDFRGRHSRLAWEYAIQVASEVGKKFPDKTLTLLAYSSYQLPPQGLDKLPSNILVGLSFQPRDNKLPGLIKPEIRKSFRDIAEQWDRLTDRPFAYWFHYFYRRSGKNQGTTFYAPHFFASLIQELSRMGNHYFCETDKDAFYLDHLSFYVLYKLLWNPQLDADELVRDYCAAGYGPAKDEMAAILASIEKLTTEKMLHEKLVPKEFGQYPASDDDMWNLYFTDEVVKGYRQRMDRALALCHNTVYEKRSELFSRCFLGSMEAARRSHFERPPEGKAGHRSEDDVEPNVDKRD